MEEVYILSAKRTAIGSFNGSLAGFTAPQLGGFAIKAAVEEAGITGADVDEVLMGNVMSANLGQAPATQAAKAAGLPDLPATTVNKVCASGLKAVAIAAQSILTGENSIVLAGGMESMSNVPYYLDKIRSGYKLGNGQLIDGLVKDGLWDVYNDYHMGSAAELCSAECGISREMQDEFTVQSYTRAHQAQTNGDLIDEIIPLELKNKQGQISLFAEDEEVKNVKFEKIPSLKPVFKKDGTVTAANASTLNDGAAALVLAGRKKVESLGLQPLARILSFADAQQAPEWFTTAPAKAIPLALERAGLSLDEIDFFEINEAFAVVSVANNQMLGIDPGKVNIHGGAVAIGHPLGASGARILVTLVHILRHKNARYGVAGICNGGGGASALVVENLHYTTKDEAAL